MRFFVQPPAAKLQDTARSSIWPSRPGKLFERGLEEMKTYMGAKAGGNDEDVSPLAGKVVGYLTSTFMGSTPWRQLE